MAARRSTALAAAVAFGALAWAKAVEQVPMYRALQQPTPGSEPMPLSNANLADLVGVLRYLAQEILPEHILDPNRRERKYGINAIAKYMVKMQNPRKLLEDKQKVQIPGFGIWGAFDYGIATTSDGETYTTLADIAKFGDFVGASKQQSPQIQFDRDWYWFSLSGACPNLPWKCIPGDDYPVEKQCTETPPATVPQPCTDGCCGKRDTEANDCTSGWDISNKKLLRTCCMNYEDDGEHVKGGLCDEGEEPEGSPGCVYNYPKLTSKDYAVLDDLAGIKDMDCGGRKCASWIDWRQHCTDAVYKRRFECAAGQHDWTSCDVVIANVEVCVEYDVHPFCQDSEGLCKDPKCQALPAHERELGLPFWLGKCDTKRNKQRVEAMANVLEGSAVAGSHMLFDKSVLAKNPSCYNPESTLCDYNSGGDFCTRRFAGVCSICHIPGRGRPNPGNFPTCPLDLLAELEEDSSPPPKVSCESKSPQDICCLYGFDDQNCDDMDSRTLDAKGYMIAFSRLNSVAMANFVERLLTHEQARVTDREALERDAYWWWDLKPPHDALAAFQAVKNDAMSADYVVSVSSTSTTTTTSSDDGDGSNSNAKVFWGLGGTLVIVAIGIAVGVGLYLSRAPAQAREAQPRQDPEDERVSMQLSRM